MLYVVDEIKRCGLPARPTLRRARRKARKHLPPTANPALTTMHSSTLANDFSFCPTLASASFQPLSSRCSRCLPSKPRVLTLLRTLFLSLHSFRLSPRLFSIACGLFLQNTGGGGTSGTSPRPPRLCVTICLFLSALYFHPLTNPSSSRIDLQHSLFSGTYKSLFPQLLCIHIYTKPRGVGSKLWLTTDSVTPA